MPALLHDMLDERAAVGPNRPALRFRDESWTYEQVRLRSRAYAWWLHEQGVRRGDRVLIRAPHSPRTVAMLYATSRLGAVAVILSDRLPPQRLAQVMLDCTPKVVLASAATSAATRSTGRVEVVLLDQLPDSPGGPLPVGGPISADPAVLIYTSGSTALPKAVVSTHAQMDFAARAIQSRLRYRPDDVVFCCLPLSFDYGLYQVLLSCLAGSELVLADEDDAGVALLSRLAEHRVSVLPLVPPLATTLILLLARGRGRRPDRLRLVTSSGARLAGTVADQLREMLPGLSVVSMFGLTECKRVTISEPDDDLLRPGTCGTALPDTEVLIVGEDGRPLPAGQVGELVVRGQHVMAGYWQAPELTATRFRRDDQGRVYLYTGDHGRLDEDGHLYFVGRRDDVYKQSGFRVSAGEVEAAAQDVPGVDLAAVLPPVGDRGAVLVVTGEAGPHTVLTQLSSRLEDFKVPSECHRLSSLPVGPNGKVDKRKLLADLPPRVSERTSR